jgi:hypothetical protein
MDVSRPTDVNVINPSTAPVPVTGTVKLDAPAAYYGRVTPGMGMGQESLNVCNFDHAFVIEYLHITVSLPADVNVWAEIASPDFGNPLVFPIDASHTLDRLVKIPLRSGSSVTVRRETAPPDSGFGVIALVSGTPL